MASPAAIYQTYRPWIDRYRGGMPAGFVAAIIAHESSGNPNAVGDASLGEAGLMQIEASFPPKVGLPSAARLDPQTNVFLGCLEYQLRAAEMAPYASPGSSDSWRLARLGFAVGSGGTRTLIAAATGNNPAAYRGRLFDQIRTWANQTGAVALSSGQPATKVLDRINAVQAQWALGQSLPSSSYGAPQKIPAPTGVRYSIPASAARYLVSPVTGTLLAIGMVGAIVYLVAIRRKEAHAPDSPPA
jgi:hypothetical protein